MRKWIKRLSNLWLFFYVLSATAQDIPLGTWRNHFSYQQARLLAAGDDRIFCAVENGIFFVNLEDNSINKLSKLDGLSDAGVTAMVYDAGQHMLLIGYASGLVDLVTEEEVFTVREIHNTALIGSKRINDIVTDAGKAFIASGFGVIVISLETKEIIENYRSIGYAGNDVTVEELAVIDGKLFARTEEFILSGSLQDNLQDFNNWVHYDETIDHEYRNFASLGDRIYAVTNQKDISYLENGAWTSMGWSSDISIQQLLANNGVLYALTEKAIYTLEEGELSLFHTFSANDRADAFLYDDGFWIADAKVGLLDPAEQPVSPAGPLTDNITRIRFINGQVFALHGPEPSFYSGTIDSLGYSYFNNSSWQSFEIPGFYNLTDVSSYQDQLFFASAGFGLYNQTVDQILDSTISVIADSKENLGTIIPELSASDLLYFISYNSRISLYTLDAERQITPYSEAFVDTDKPESIDISEESTLWLRDSYGGAVALNLPNDEFRRIDENDGLPSGAIQDIQIDLEDEAWIATTAGPVVFPDASFVFDQFNATQPIFENRELFEGEAVSALAVDGGNRIWMSTVNGITLFSQNFSEQIAHFNTDNSPLPSNDIQEFAYNPVNGEMYILTSKGLVSYRTGSSKGDDHSSVSIFPNPVRPGYSGLVGITGVVRDASVKITDIHGKLIRQLTANGGTASWDLLDYNRNEVQSGIYVIFSSSADGEDTYIGKLAVIH